MNRLPNGYRRELRRIRTGVKNVDGWLTEREIDFLALLAACPSSAGDILELGPYRGKSTIALAQAASLSDHTRVVTVDPEADEMLRRNLEQAGVDKSVEVHRAYSWDVIANWRRPIRLLWHDGANTYDVVTQDMKGVLSHLQDFAIVAFHDVLNPSGERSRVFLEQVLDSEHFGSVGVCGSIGWGQYRSDPGTTQAYRKTKQRLRHRIQRLTPYQSATKAAPAGLTNIRYKLLRSRVPHGRVNPDAWIRQVSRDVGT